MEQENMAISFNPEDIAAIAEALKPMVVEAASEAAHGAVTKRNESFEKRIDKFLEQKLAKPKDEEPEEQEEYAKTVRALEEKFKLSEKKLRDELKAEKEANSRKSMRSNLEQALLKAGIQPGMLKAVSAQLIHEDKLVDLDNDGNATFKVPGYNNEVLPLEEGLSQWLKTDGKTFIPPPVAKGAGIRPIRSNVSTLVDPDDMAELDSAIIAAVRRF
jgi:hypothetical protein